MSTSLENSISQELENLSPVQQNQVLKFVRKLKLSQNKEELRKAILSSAGSIPHDDIERMKEAINDDNEQFKPRGTPGSDLMKFVGAISLEDLELMKTAIEEDCEQVDPHGW